MARADGQVVVISIDSTGLGKGLFGPQLILAVMWSLSLERICDLSS